MNRCDRTVKPILFCSHRWGTARRKSENTVGTILQYGRINPDHVLEEWRSVVYKGDVSLVEEIAEQDFEGVAYGACTTNTFSLSDALTNTGGWCTLTVECQPNCN
ncbi:plantaricin C family lantibiotic [Streptomyces sp. HNM0575]|nr:plantaricin C family lantibiotic [Streptomyces sp. HNM0575]